MVVTLYCALLAVVAFICALAVLHPRYEDNLLQRVGMAITCIGATAQIFVTWAGMYGMHSRLFLVAGVAIFAVGTLWKHFLRCRRAAISAAAQSASRTRWHPEG